MEDAKRHCLLGGSSAERWINCPPSARLTEDMDDQTSEYAIEGTKAHALCEYKLNKALGNKAKKPDSSEFDDQMDEASDGYVSFVLEQLETAREAAGEEPPVAVVEHEVAYDSWVMGGFGTCDALIACNGRLHVIDFKYGLGVKVDATDNSQLKIYSLDAIQELDCLYDFDKVLLTIYQPRIGNVSTWKTTKAELLKWAEEVLKPAAELADRGEGIYRSGPWFRFCKAQAVCRGKEQGSERHPKR